MNTVTCIINLRPPQTPKCRSKGKGLLMEKPDKPEGEGEEENGGGVKRERAPVREVGLVILLQEVRK